MCLILISQLDLFCFWAISSLQIPHARTVSSVTIFSSLAIVFKCLQLLTLCSFLPYVFQIQVNLRELEAAAWFSHDEVATALRRKGPYIQQENETLPFSLPPRLAIAHQLIKEWMERHACSSRLAQPRSSHLDLSWVLKGYQKSIDCKGEGTKGQFQAKVIRQGRRQAMARYLCQQCQ